MNKYKVVSVVLALTLIILSSVFLYSMSNPYVPEISVTEVRFAYQFGFHYGQHIIIDHFNLLQKYSNGTAIGIFQKISGGTAINEAFVAGSLEFGSMGIAPAIKGVDQQIGTKILLSMGSKEHELWTWREDIQSIADIKRGDKVGVVKLGSIEQAGLIKAFGDLGRTKEEADAVSVFFTHPDAFQLMEEKQIDCAFTGVPYTIQYANAVEVNPEGETKSKYHMVTCDTEIWGTPLPGSSLIGRVEFCEEHPELLSAVMTAWFKATEYIINNPQEASKIIGLVYEYEPDEAWDLWLLKNRLGQPCLMWNPTFGLSAVEDIAAIMHKLDLIQKTLTFEDMLFAETKGLIGK